MSSNAITSRSSGDCPRRSSLVVVVISIRLMRFTNTSARRIFPVTVEENNILFILNWANVLHHDTSAHLDYKQEWGLRQQDCTQNRKKWNTWLFFIHCKISHWPKFDIFVNEIKFIKLDCRQAWKLRNRVSGFMLLSDIVHRHIDFHRIFHVIPSMFSAGTPFLNPFCFQDTCPTTSKQLTKVLLLVNYSC